MRFTKWSVIAIAVSVLALWFLTIIKIASYETYLLVSFGSFAALSLMLAAITLIVDPCFVKKLRMEAESDD
jgi:hypothetical protein